MEQQQYPTINIEEEMQQSYMDYAMSVIVGRALPDVRDGLKPVQRRVLYAMFSEGLVSNKKHSKCAGVVGEVLKKFHPHGDMPVYEALVRLAQSWSLRYPLVDGQGNFGSVDGDPPAAYRYTESRMAKIAERLLDDIEKETVNFIPNFDDSTNEPTVLPATIPNLLINGADGIAVGMATHIPPHNLREVIAATVALIENSDITSLQLMDHLPGPDFPTGGIIYGKDAIRSAYTTGKGIIHVRARTHFEKIKTNTREVEGIVITEIPFQVNKAKLVERIAELVNNREIEGISRLRDESDRKGMRIVIELRKDATPEVVLNQLFKATALQSSFGVINLAIVEGRPAICTLKQLLSCFIDHRRDVVTRRTQFELRQASDRMHILEGFRIALLNIDEIIQLIKGSADGKEAKEGLMAKYELSAIQSQAILDLRLQKLTGMERLAIEKEYEELKSLIEALKALLADTNKIDALIVNELKEISEIYGDDRRTEIIAQKEEILTEDMIEDEEMVVSISHEGYVKRTASTEYRAQRRGGKGVAGTANKEEDFVEHLFVASTHADLLVFTTLGRLYWQKVYQIPEAGRTARGRALVNLLDLKEGEKHAAILPIREYKDEQCLIMATKRGIIKKVKLSEFKSRRAGGIIACSLDEGDTLISVAISSGNDDIFMVTKEGKSIRFSEEEIRATGRSSRGVRGIRLSEGEDENAINDEVVSMTVVPAGVVEEGAEGEDSTNANENSEAETDTKDDGLRLLSICQNGYGKRTPISAYRVQSRGGKGIIAIQTGERNGPVVSAFVTQTGLHVMLITSSGKIIRVRADDISSQGRNTQGVRIIGLEEGEVVVAAAPVVADEE